MRSLIAPTLLWLHGRLPLSPAWSPQREHFAALKYRSVYVDLCGHGDSTRDPGLYDITRFGEQMNALIARLELTSVVCIGHSLGGMVAQAMARRRAPALKGIVLADTTYSTQSTFKDRAQTALARATFAS